jgi:hypothetical protein
MQKTTNLYRKIKTNHDLQSTKITLIKMSLKKTQITNPSAQMTAKSPHKANPSSKNAIRKKTSNIAVTTGSN